MHLKIIMRAHKMMSSLNFILSLLRDELAPVTLRQLF